MSILTFPCMGPALLSSCAWQWLGPARSVEKFSCGHQPDPDEDAVTSEILNPQPLRIHSHLDQANVSVQSSYLQMPPHSPPIPLHSLTHTIYHLCSLLLWKPIWYFFLISSTWHGCRQKQMLHSNRCKIFCSLPLRMWWVQLYGRMKHCIFPQVL